MLINKHEKETQRHPFDDPDVKGFHKSMKF